MLDFFTFGLGIVASLFLVHLVVNLACKGYYNAKFDYLCKLDTRLNMKGKQENEQG